MMSLVWSSPLLSCSIWERMDTKERTSLKVPSANWPIPYKNQHPSRVIKLKARATSWLLVKELNIIPTAIQQAVVRNVAR